MDCLRFEAEYACASHDVDTHRNVQAAGIALGSEDAAVLVSGAAANLGISVADLVADGSVFAFQVMAGLNYICSEQLSFFGGLRWCQTDDIEVSANLLPADFDIENQSWLAEIGARWKIAGYCRNPGCRNTDVFAAYDLP